MIIPFKLLVEKFRPLRGHLLGHYDFMGLTPPPSPWTMFIKTARLVFTWTRISAWQSASRPRASLPLSLQLGGGRTLVEIPLHIIWFFDYQLTIGYIHEQREEGGKDWKSHHSCTSDKRRKEGWLLRRWWWRWWWWPPLQEGVWAQLSEGGEGGVGGQAGHLVLKMSPPWWLWPRGWGFLGADDD